MTNAINGRCRLHGGDAVLQDSHIIPRWAYVRGKGPSKDHLVAFKGDCIMFDDRQISEHLLCSPCEQKLGVWDAYAAEVSRKDSGFTALDQAKRIPGLGEDDLYGADIGALDVGALARFGVAVFWRASICSKTPTVRLGPYEDGIRDYLLGKADLPRHACLVLQLLRPAPSAPIDETIALYESGRMADGGHLHQFVVFGLLYMLLVGRQLPASAYEMCLVRTNRVMVGYSDHVFRALGMQIATAPRKGKFARI